jgi:hypothetical protein
MWCPPCERDSALCAGEDSKQHGGVFLGQECGNRLGISIREPKCLEEVVRRGTVLKLSA